MLNTYVQQVQRLLHNVTNTLYSPTDLAIYVNDARMQVAMEGQCVRATSTRSISSGVNNFGFASLTFPSFPGIDTAINARSVLANGTWVQPRNWEWFTFYCSTDSSTSALPFTWSQYGDGVDAQLFIWPTPSLNLTLVVDAACFPVVLTTDATVESIPFPFQRAIKYYAAYLAFLSVMRSADADNMSKLFAQNMLNARAMTRATVLPGNANSDWSLIDRANAGGTSNGA